jgi:hypothetical protein
MEGQEVAPAVDFVPHLESENSDNLLKKSNESI